MNQKSLDVIEREIQNAKIIEINTLRDKLLQYNDFNAEEYGDALQILVIQRKVNLKIEGLHRILTSPDSLKNP